MQEIESIMLSFQVFEELVAKCLKATTWYMPGWDNPLPIGQRMENAVIGWAMPWRSVGKRNGWSST